MRALALCGVLLLLAGCLGAEPTASVGQAEAPAAADDAASPGCTPANTNNYGIAVNGVYLAQAEVWHETNGIPNLQTTVSCEGPADTRAVPP